MLRPLYDFFLGFLSEQYATVASVLSVVAAVLLVYCVLIKGFVSIFVRDHDHFKLPDIVIGVLLCAFILTQLTPMIRRVNYDGGKWSDSGEVEVKPSVISYTLGGLYYELDMQPDREYIAYVGSTGSTIVMIDMEKGGVCYLDGGVLVAKSDCIVYKISASGVVKSTITGSDVGVRITSYSSAYKFESTVPIYGPDMVEVVYEKTIDR